MQTHCNNQERTSAFRAAGITLILVGWAGVAGAETFEMMVHKRDELGARYIENGEYEKGVQRLEARLGGDKSPNSYQTPILIDLCVGYAMLGEFQKATDNCNKAIDSGWYSGLAYNNRGAVRIAQGQYEEAIQDFQTAIEHKGADALASRNLDRAQRRVAQLQRQNEGTAVAAATVDGGRGQ